MKKVIYSGIVLVVVTLSFFVGKWMMKRSNDINVQNLIAARDSVKHSIIQIKGLTEYVATQSALILSKDEAIKAGYIEKEKLRKLNLRLVITNTELEAKVKIMRDSLDLPPKVEFITIKDSSGISRDYVRTPFTLLDIKEPYLTLGAGMGLNRKAWFNLEMPIVGEITVGYQKKKPVGVFTSPNPYLTVNTMNVVIVPEKKMWYDNKWVTAGLAAVLVESINLLLRKQK